MLTDECIADCASAVIQNGYAILGMPPELKGHLFELERQMPEVPPQVKQQFSFLDKGDGFLPFGSEYAENNPNHPDLCERFCYFAKNRQQHSRHAFHTSSFYASVAAYEAGMSMLAPRVLQAICSRYRVAPPASPGRDSYIQICAYTHRHRKSSHHREYLMDPHVDGQLLTFIAHTEQGLAVRDSDGSFRIVHFLPGELFVMAGELLEAASDGEITGVRHAVKEANSGAARLSIMYFLNPDFTKAPYPSFVSRRPVDFLKLANVIHQRFGNPVYAVD